MRDVERDVKDLLRSMGDEAGDLGELPTPVRRRVIGRRAAVVLGGAAVLLAVVIGGASVASGLFSNETSPANPVPASSEDAPEAPWDTEGEPVATGTFDGGRWWLTAYVDGEDEICTELATEEADGSGGSGGGCGPFDPDRYPIGLGVQSGSGGAIASGHVHQSVARLELVLENGERLAIGFYDAPDGFPLPVKFYVIAPFPQPDAEELIAYDAEGMEVGRQKIFGPEDRAKIEKVSGPFLIEAAEHEGIPYTLKGRLERQVTPSGERWLYPCTMFMLGEDESYGGGGSCHIPLGRQHEVNFSQTSFESLPGIVAIHGAAASQADRVAIELKSGDAFDAELYEVEDSDFIFFLVFPDASPDDLIGEVVAYRGAVELDRVELCDPEMASAGGSCGP